MKFLFQLLLIVSLAAPTLAHAADAQRKRDEPNRGGSVDLSSQDPKVAAERFKLQSGYAIGTALQGNVVVSGLNAGTHGYAPDIPEMNASFFAAGPGIPHCDAGSADMRQVAPTVAGYLGIMMPTAKQSPIRCAAPHSSR